MNMSCLRRCRLRLRVLRRGMQPPPQTRINLCVVNWCFFSFHLFSKVLKTFASPCVWVWPLIAHDFVLLVHTRSLVPVSFHIQFSCPFSFNTRAIVPLPLPRPVQMPLFLYSSTPFLQEWRHHCSSTFLRSPRPCSFRRKEYVYKLALQIYSFPHTDTHARARTYSQITMFPFCNDFSS